MRWLLALLALLSLPAQAQSVLIQGARVFDNGKAQVRDVLVRGDRIVEVRKHVKPPADARIVDARGLTLIPGLHDLHIHTGSEAFVSADALTNGYAAYLAAGVTSVNEYSVAGRMLAGIRALNGAQVPHLQLAIRLGVPGGHGTESGFTNSITMQVTNPIEAHAAIAQALPYRPDLIKVFADGWRYDDPERDNRASMDEPTLAAIVADAHRAGIPVVTHTVTLAGAKIAARAGVDAVVHGIGDALVDHELIRLMKRRHMAYVPTLVVYEPQENRAMLAEDWLLLRPRQRIREEERRNKPREEIPAYEAKRWEIMRENVRRLHKAGVPIGLGTDTGIGGVYPGWAALREIRMLVELGFTPGQALTAATVTSARIMGQARGHGRIKPGQRADLVLTGGRPDERIEDLYDVRRVFVSGREVDLPMLRALMAATVVDLNVHRLAEADGVRY